MTNGQVAFIFALALFAAPAAAGITPDPAASPPAPDPQRAAFLALPESDRKAMQDALGWLGFYNGGVDGAFGKRSIESLVAYQQSVAAPADGIATSKQLADLREGARKAKAAIGFQMLDDASSGVRIGAPLKWLERRESSPGATRLSNTDGALTLDLVEASGPLGDLFKRALSDKPGRRIAYKAMKADAFFVVAWEEAGRKYYRRVAKAPADAPDPKITRGFVFGYPAERAKALDPIALAIANAFDPFPTTPAPGGAKPAPGAASAPSGPKLTATALVIGKGEAVTFLSPADCAEPQIGGKPARFVSGGEGLARLEGDFPGAALDLSASLGGGDLMVLSFAPAAGGKAVLQVADAQSLASARILAALDASARGAPVLDRRGALAGIVAPLAGAPTRRAGVALSLPHRIVAAAALAGLPPIGPARPGEPSSAAEVAKRMRNSLAPVFCGA